MTNLASARPYLARLATLCVTAGLAACSPAAPPPVSNATVYEGARLIDGNGGPAIEGAVLVVEDGRFTAVGAAGQVQVPAGAARVDLSGKTVMPALIDTHVHPSTERDVITTQLQSKAAFGVSAVLSMGLDGPVAFDIRNSPIPGASRLLTAGRGITRPEPGRSEVPYWIDTPEEGRKAVQELASQKVDIVKIWVDDRDGKFPKLTPELYGAVIDEAHQAGLRVAAHIYSLEDAKGLLKAGIDAFAHGIRDRDVDDEFMTMLEARPDLVLIPNMPDRGVATDMSWLKGRISDGELEKIQAAATDRPAAQQSFGIQARNLARMHGAGVKVAMGTDGFSAWSHHMEMADMAASGLTPAEVIVAATKTSAEFLRLADSGTIESGKRADFIVLDANPLDDITNTRRIDAVYLEGTRVGQ